MVSAQKCFECRHLDYSAASNLSRRKDFCSNIALDCAARDAKHPCCVSRANGEFLSTRFHGREYVHRRAPKQPA